MTEPAADPAARLWRLWDQGLRPDLAEFLMMAAPLEPLDLAAVLRVDQERRWLVGQRLPAEHYLTAYPAVTADEEAVLDVAYGEFDLRDRAGEAVDPEEFFHRFPRLAEPLRAQFELRKALAGAEDSPTLPRPAEGGEPDPTRPGFHGPLGKPPEENRTAGGWHDAPTRSPGAPASSLSAEPFAVPGYEILEELGRGGMGVVYKARQVGLNRVVALKMILAGGHAAAQDRMRFRVEAEAVGRLQHPNIVQVHEVGEHEGKPYFSMEFCPGGGLDKKLMGAPVPPAEAGRLIETLARAIHAAHLQNIVHRDLKPANVLLAADGTPKVADFGLAKRLDEEGRTRTGDVLGTPSYMAPEQAVGKSGRIGPAVDVYALGSILYELLTGRPPFRGPTPMETLQQVLSDEPAAPRRVQSKVPADLETVCLKCLEKRPERRYTTAEELAEDLRRFREGEPVRARRVGPLERAWKWARRRPARMAAYGLLAAALVLGLGGGGATWLWLRAENARGEAQTARDDLRGVNDSLKQARDDLKDANRRLTEHACIDRITLAERQWEAGAAKQARELLAQAAGLQEELTPGRRSWEFDYLDRFFHQELAVLDGPADGLSSAAFSPDGRRIATASWGGTAQLWDAASGRRVAVLEGHAGEVRWATFSPDGLRVATAGQDRTVRLWDAETGGSLGKLTPPEEGVAGFHSVAFSPDGRQLVAGGQDGKVRLWDAASREQIAVLEGHTADVWCAAFSPDGRRIATASQDGTARLWDAASRRQIAVLQKQTAPVHAVAFSPDGGRLATAGDDGTVRLWDAASREQIAALKGYTGPAISVVFSPDGGGVATGGLDGTARLWDAASGRQLAVLQGHTGTVHSVVFSPDGGRVATAGEDGTARLWDAASAPQRIPLEGHVGIVSAVAFSPDGGHVVTGGQDGTSRLWDVASGRQLAVLGGHANPVQSVAFSPDGGRVATAAAVTVRLWDAVSGRPVGKPLDGHTNLVWCVAFSPNGTRVATASWDGTARLWVTDSGEQSAVLAGHKGIVSAAAFSPDGGRVVTAGQDGTARLWDARSGRPVRLLEGHTGVVWCAAFSPDGGQVATGSGDGTVRLWDADSGKQLAVLTGHTGPVQAAVFSPDGARIATASQDGTARLWDAASGKQLLLLEEHRDQVWHIWSVAFSPDGGRIATAGQDGTAQLWVAREASEARDRRRRLWRERQAAAAESDGRWFAAAFHLSRLIDADPADPSLYVRRCRAYALQGLWVGAVADGFAAAEGTDFPTAGRIACSYLLGHFNAPPIR